MKKRLERALSFEGAQSRRSNWKAIGVLIGSLVLGAILAPAATNVYKIGGEVSAPKIVHKQEPKYTASAKRDKVQGVAVLQIVVTSKGHPEDIKIVKSLRPDMDQQAIKAVSKWRFEPARKDGRPVAVSAKVEVNFRLL